MSNPRSKDTLAQAKQMRDPRTRMLAHIIATQVFESMKTHSPSGWFIPMRDYKGERNET